MWSYWWRGFMAYISKRNRAKLIKRKKKKNEQVNCPYCNLGRVCLCIGGMWPRLPVHAVRSGRFWRIERILLILLGKELDWWVQKLICLLVRLWEYLWHFQARRACILQVRCNGLHWFLPWRARSNDRPWRWLLIQLLVRPNSVFVRRLRWRGGIDSWRVWRCSKLHCHIRIAPCPSHFVLHPRHLH